VARRVGEGWRRPQVGKWSVEVGGQAGVEVDVVQRTPCSRLSYPPSNDTSSTGRLKHSGLINGENVVVTR